MDVSISTSTAPAIGQSLTTMRIEHIPILLTSSVTAFDKGVHLQDAGQRASYALESINRWRQLAPLNPLVLCDGSNFDFSPVVASVTNSTSIECLSFQNNIDRVQRQGRGYGEGEIVRFAIENSSFIQNSGCFAKCTSKLWVDNFSQCMGQWNNAMLLKGVFHNAFSPIHSKQFAYIDTRFYAMDVEIYNSHFLYAHEAIETSSGYGLEECFRDVYLSLGCPSSLMGAPPVICGVGGGTGTYYKNSKLRKIKERLRYALIRSDPLYKSWFV
jgi:hypothetical protein